MQKKCPKCNKVKSFTEFHKDKSRKHGLQVYCKSCNIELNKLQYKNKSQEFKIRARRKRNELLAIAAKIKSDTGCFFCKERESACLDFHHLKDKKNTISYFARIKNLKKMMYEINKCIVVCSNCHRKLHFGILHLPASVA